MDGTYRLCADSPNGIWLNPCEWGLQAPVVSVSAAQPTGNINVVLKKGVAVPVRIEDPALLLTKNEGKTPGAHLLLGIGTDASVFRIAQIVSQDSAGRDHQIVVPFNSSVKLVVYSSFFQLSDGNGIPFPRKSIGIPILISPGQQVPIIKLKVTGGGQQ
jgi:hypothetical protein